jgi:hypothetical protein
VQEPELPDRLHEVRQVAAVAAVAEPPAAPVGSGTVEELYDAAVRALAAAGIAADIERNGVGQLVVDVRGEVVDQWDAPEGHWVAVVAEDQVSPSRPFA